MSELTPEERARLYSMPTATEVATKLSEQREPLMDALKAAGMTPRELAQQVKNKLRRRDRYHYVWCDDNMPAHGVEDLTLGDNALNFRTETFGRREYMPGTGKFRGTPRTFVTLPPNWLRAQNEIDPDVADAIMSLVASKGRQMQIAPGHYVTAIPVEDWDALMNRRIGVKWTIPHSEFFRLLKMHKENPERLRA